VAVLCARSEPREAYLAVMAGNTCKSGRQIDLGHVTAKLWYSRAIERKGKYSFVCGAEARVRVFAGGRARKEFWQCVVQVHRRAVMCQPDKA